MGRGVKIVLSIAIALIFPTMIGLLVFLVFPDNKNIPEPKYPQYTEISDYCNGYNSRNYSSRYSYDSDCITNREKNLQAEYNEKLKEYKKQKNSASINRINASLIAVIIGFIIAIFLTGFSPLSVGITGGSTILLMTTTGLLSGFSENINGFTIGLYLGCFAILIYLLFRLDSMFPEPDPILDTSTNNSSPEQTEAKKSEASSIYPTPASIKMPNEKPSPSKDIK